MWGKKSILLISLDIFTVYILEVLNMVLLYMYVYNYYRKTSELM